MAYSSTIHTTIVLFYKQLYITSGKSNVTRKHMYECNYTTVYTEMLFNMGQWNGQQLDQPDNNPFPTFQL